MRYNIKQGKVVESILIDAPFDTKKDAQDAIELYSIFNYDNTMLEPEFNTHDLDALEVINLKKAWNNQLIGE